MTRDTFWPVTHVTHQPIDPCDAWPATHKTRRVPSKSAEGIWCLETANDRLWVEFGAVATWDSLLPKFVYILMLYLHYLFLFIFTVCCHFVSLFWKMESCQLDHGATGHEYWPVTQSDLLTHLTRDPLTHCHLWYIYHEHSVTGFHRCSMWLIIGHIYI